MRDDKARSGTSSSLRLRPVGREAVASMFERSSSLLVGERTGGADLVGESAAEGGTAEQVSAGRHQPTASASPSSKQGVKSEPTFVLLVADDRTAAEERVGTRGGRVSFPSV